MYLASKDTEPLLCHCLACRVCKDAPLGKNKPELSPGAGLRWGLRPEILTHGAEGLPCTCLCMKEFPVSNRSKLKPRTQECRAQPRFHRGLQLH